MKGIRIPIAVSAAVLIVGVAAGASAMTARPATVRGDCGIV